MRTFILALVCLTAACSGADTPTTAQVAAAGQAVTVEQAVTTPSEPQEVTPTKYVCPMCAGVESDGPGECPHCGMALVQAGEAAAAAPEGDCGCDKHGEGDAHEGDAHEGRDHADCPHNKAVAVYTCPMHPEVRQDGPGACPTCGMDLVPATEPAQGAEGHDHHDH